LSIDHQRLLNEVGKQYNKVARIKKCFYHNHSECKGKVKQAHSIQKSGKLSILESEVNGNQSLYTFNRATQSFTNMMEDLIPIGKKEATTFFGFCDYHDSKLFSKIENNSFSESDEELFLHSYRSFAHSYHTKIEEIQAWNSIDSDYEKIIIKSYGEEIVNIKRAQFESLGEHLIKRKKILDQSIETKEFNNLNYLSYKYDGILPFATSGLITPSVSYSGRIMNNSDHNNLIISQPILTILPDNDYSILIISAFEFDTLSTEYIDQLDQMPTYKFHQAISSIIIDSCQNTVFSPKFWDNLSPKEKRLILDEYSWKSMENKGKFKEFKSKFNFIKSKYYIKK
jgi:hypothetical protein